jgi:hypothetical protein
MYLCSFYRTIDRRSATTSTITERVRAKLSLIDVREIRRKDDVREIRRKDTA